MYLKQIIYFIFIITFIACYSPSTATNTSKPLTKSTKVEIKDYSFFYDANQTSINGYFNISLVDPLDNRSMPQGLELTNFVLNTECMEESHNFSSSRIYLLDNIYSKKMDLNITFLKPCNQLNFTISADKIIRTIDNNSSDNTLITEVESWSKVFKIYSSKIEDRNLKLDIPMLEVNSKGDIRVKFVNSLDSDIDSVKLTIIDPSQLKFTENPTNNIYSYSQDSNRTISIESGLKSGETDIKLEAIFRENGKDMIIDKLFKVTILSAPINSISIIQDPQKSHKKIGAFFENSYQIHAIDRYGNIANQIDDIYIGAVNGVREGGNGEYLTSIDGGELITENNRTRFVYNGNNLDFSTIDILDDKLLILAKNSRMDLSYLGAWSISKETNSVSLDKNTLYLKENYINDKNISTNNLKFVIGNSERYNSRLDSISIINIDKNDTMYGVDERGEYIFNGIGTFKLQYDPDLIGRSAFIYINILTKNKGRVGASINELLGGGIKDGFIKSTPVIVKNDENKSITIIKDILLSTEDNISVRYAIVSATATSGICEVVGTYDESSSKTNSDGNAPFKIVVPPLGSCTIEITHIFKDTDKGNYD